MTDPFNKLCQNLNDQFQRNYKQLNTSVGEIQAIIKKDYSMLDLNKLNSDQLKNIIKSIRNHYQQKLEIPQANPNPNSNPNSNSNSNFKPSLNPSIGTQKNQMSPTDIMESEINTWSYFVVIDSKDRDFDLFIRPNNYVIDMSPASYSSSDERKGYIPRSFHNVISVELVSCFMLNTSTEEDSSDHSSVPPYIILEIPELMSNLNATNDSLSKGFAMLTTYTTQGSYRYYDIDNSRGTKMIKNYEQRINIPKLTVKFMKPDGSLYNFGNNNNSNSDTVNCITLKVTLMRHHLNTTYLLKENS